MTHNINVESLARELQLANEMEQMVSVPFSERPGFDLNMAYEVEGRLKQLRESAGHAAVGIRLRRSRGRAVSNDRKRDFILCNRHDRYVRNLFLLRRNAAQRCGEDCRTVVVVRGNRARRCRVGLPGERLVRAKP